MEALNGKITVQSELGKWTEFIVDFPFTNTTFDINEISPKLATAQVFIVGDMMMNTDVEKAVEIFQIYQIDYAIFPSMQKIEAMLQSGELLKGVAYVCVCQENLFDFEVFKLFQNVHKCLLITFGPDFSVEKSSKHFRSLTETFPSVLAKTLAVLVGQLQGQANSLDASIKSILSLESPWKSLRVLIAEDNLVNQKVLKRILNRLDIHDIAIVSNGQEAVKREAQESFDLVLMDMQMPIMDGIEACQEIKKREGGHPKAKIIFVTAHVADSFKETCIENGAVGYLPKPCTKDAVKEVLKHVMTLESKSNSSRSL